MKEFDVNVNGNDFKLMCRIPTADEINESDVIFATKMSSLIRAGKKERLLLRGELEDFLRKNEIWTDKDIDQHQEYQTFISKGLAKLKKGGIKLSEARKISIEISDVRRKMIDLVQKRHQYEDLTMESVAEQEKTDYLIYLCTIDINTKERFWESFDALKADKSEEVYEKAKSVFLEVTLGLSEDIVSVLPEVKWLKKHGFINDKYELIDKNTGKPVDKDGNELKLENNAPSFIVDIEEEEAFEDDYAIS